MCKDKHKHSNVESHAHDHGGVFGEQTELIFSICCGVLLSAGFGLSFIDSVADWVSLVFYVVAYFFGGFYTAKEAVETVVKGGFEIDFLMLLAAIGAAILGEWAEGALLLFLFSLGHALEHFAMGKAHKSIASLTDLAPKTALRKEGTGSVEVNVEKLKPRDVIIVKPHAKIPADGRVVKGTSSVDQSSITGESIPVDKSESFLDPELPLDKLPAENRVFSGTINGSGLLEVEVMKLAKDSTLSRLVTLVNKTKAQKSPTQLLTDRFEKYFVPSVLVLVFLLNFAFLVVDEPFSTSFYRAMAVLVAASPCTLAIATPSAVLSGIARAANNGVLIKGGRPLEDLGVLTAIAFDKTGTLTEGRPRITKVVPIDVSEEDLLVDALSVESLSDHPLAKALVRDGMHRLNGKPLKQADHVKAVIGKGIKASIGEDQIYIGNLELFEALDDVELSPEIIDEVKSLQAAGNTAILIRKNGTFIGIIALMDTPRKEAKEMLAELKKLGIQKMIMLSGDDQTVADAIGREVGLTSALGGLLPEEKVTEISLLRERESKIAMVGDGVNDAPAMANATVGIAMGAAGSDVALETADIALMSDKLTGLPFAIGLSRKAKGIIKQNLWASLGVVALLVPLTVFGVANIGWAVLIHEGSTILVVFNALRLLRYKKN